MKKQTESQRLQLDSHHYSYGDSVLENWGEWQDSLPAPGPSRSVKLSSIYKNYQPRYRDLPKSRKAITSADEALLCDQVICLVINNRALIDMLDARYARSDTRGNIAMSWEWWKRRHKSNLSESKFKQHLHEQILRVGENMWNIHQGVLDIQLLGELFHLQNT